MGHRDPLPPPPRRGEGEAEEITTPTLPLRGRDILASSLTLAGGASRPPPLPLPAGGREKRKKLRPRPCPRGKSRDPDTRGKSRDPDNSGSPARGREILGNRDPQPNPAHAGNPATLTTVAPPQGGRRRQVGRSLKRSRAMISRWISEGP